MPKPAYYIRYNGDPNTFRTPNRIDELCIDNANDSLYYATGLTSTDWTPLGGAGSTISSLQTYTPTFTWSGGGTSVTYNRQDGNYITLGGVLTWFTCDIDFTLSGVGTGGNTGNAQFDLPVDSVTTNGEIALLNVRWVTEPDMDWNSGTQLYANIDPNRSYFTLRTQADGFNTLITDTRLNNSRYRFIVNGMYASA